MKKSVLFLLLFLISISVSAETKFIIDAGHYSPIVDIQYNESKNLIFTAEETGSITIWNKREETLRSRFQVTSKTIDQIIESPVDNYITILSHDSEKYYLSVWDWKFQRELFTRRIEEQPLFLEYSGKGRYLFYGNIQNPSLTFINAQNGVSLNYLSNLPSIYDYGFLGSSEKTIMTYSSSGSIKFFNLRTGENLKNVTTLNGLDNLNVIKTGDKKLFSARKDNDLFLIDRLNGNVINTIQFDELLYSSQNNTNGIILTIERLNRKRIIKKWCFNCNKSIFCR